MMIRDSGLLFGPSCRSISYSVSNLCLHNCRYSNRSPSSSYLSFISFTNNRKFSYKHL